MMRGSAAPSILFGLVCIGTTACISLGPKADPTRFFTLTPLARSEEAAHQSSLGPGTVILGVGPITLPGYLDREQLVTRVSETRFDVAENDRWAEPLGGDVARVLSQNLAALLGDRVRLYPWPNNQQPTYQVEIEVLRFEADTTRNAQLAARWTLRDVAGRETLSVRESRLAEPVKGSTTEESVMALSRLLGAFGSEIAGALRALSDRH